MPNPYARDVSHIKTLDPYRLQELYKMHPCAEHVVKKLLVAGEREGGKDLDHDISDCIRTLKRWQEMRAEDREGPVNPQTKYEWGAVPKQFKFIAADEDGGVYMYDREPVAGASEWRTTGSGCAEPHPASSHAYALTPAWRESLERRP